MQIVTMNGSYIDIANDFLMNKYLGATDFIISSIFSCTLAQ